MEKLSKTLFIKNMVKDLDFIKVDSNEYQCQMLLSVHNHIDFKKEIKLCLPFLFITTNIKKKFLWYSY